jgi:pyruvate dehydrogenase E1 component beta subunit
MFAHAPGLKIIVPSSAYDIKGLLKSALRDDSPILCFSDANVGAQRGEVPAGDYTIPIGLADIKREGSDVTIVAVAAAVNHSLAAAKTLAEQGISAEIVDVRSVVPLDRTTIIKSVVKTGRVIVVDPAPAMCGLSAEVSALVMEHAFDSLKAPAVRLTAPQVPVPFSPSLERTMYPTPESIAAAVRKLCESRRSMGMYGERAHGIASASR